MTPIGSDKLTESCSLSDSQVLSLVFDGPLVRMRDGLQFGLLMGIVQGVGMVALGSFIRGAGSSQHGLQYFLFPAIVILMTMIWTRRATALFEAAQLSRIRVPLNDAILPDVLAYARGLHANSGLKAFARQLISLGLHGTVIRFAPATTKPIGATIDYPFEPRLIDDCGKEAGELNESPNDSRGAMSAAKEKVRAMGGWYAVLAILFVWSISGISALIRAQLTIEFLMFSILVLFICVAPMHSTKLFGAQWFAVPGGMVRRKALPWRTKWDVHVFDRRQSVLLVVHYFRHQWCAIVADAECAEMAIGTESQIAFMLRAWLSPLDPPQIERLRGQW